VSAQSNWQEVLLSLASCQAARRSATDSPQTVRYKRCREDNSQTWHVSVLLSSGLHFLIALKDKATKAWPSLSVDWCGCRSSTAATCSSLEDQVLVCPVAIWVLWTAFDIPFSLNHGSIIEFA
jgi:hypothetical protein